MALGLVEDRHPPVDPFTRMRWPVVMREVAVPVPTTAGSPYSRDTIAAWDVIPPMSVTVAAILEKIGAHAGEVIVRRGSRPGARCRGRPGRAAPRRPSTSPGDAAAPLSSLPSCEPAHCFRRCG